MDLKNLVIELRRKVDLLQNTQTVFVNSEPSNPKTNSIWIDKGTSKFWDGANWVIGGVGRLTDWNTSVSFSATTYNIIVWSLGIVSVGTTDSKIDYATTDGDFTMTTTTYFYWQADLPTTIQTTTTPGAVVVAGGILLAVGRLNPEVANKASIKAFGGPTVDKIIIDNIVANSITANMLQVNSVNSSKISVAQLSAISADMGSLTAGQIVVGSTNKLWLNDANDGALAIGGSTKASAPLLISANGDIRGNKFTNKSIFYEAVTAPTTSDGQMYCNTNGGSGKVLWGYFGGDINAQQVSMSRMQAAGTFDRTTGTTINVSTWFQPRLLMFNGFFENTNGGSYPQYYGTTNGQAGSVASSQGFCNSIRLKLDGYVPIATGSTIFANLGALLPTAIDGGGNVTAYYGSQNYASYTGSLSSTTVFTGIAAANVVDAFATDSITKNCYAYVSAWSNTGLTITVVVASGWRITGNYTILG